MVVQQDSVWKILTLSKFFDDYGKFDESRSGYAIFLGDERLERMATGLNCSFTYIETSFYAEAKHKTMRVSCRSVDWIFRELKRGLQPSSI